MNSYYQYFFLQDKIKNLEETNETLGDTAKSLRALLESEREQNAKNQDLVRVLLLCLLL